MIGRNDFCWCGSGKKWKKCHYPETSSKPQPAPAEKETLRKEYYRKHRIILKNERQIAGIRESCQLAAKILTETCKQAKAGITTQQLNDFAHKMHLDAGAIPAPLHYGSPPFPKSICTSLNEVICHGIPDDVPLQEGDILNIDVSCILNGYYGDCSRMVIIGQVNPERQHICDVAYECLMRGIAVLKPGALLSDIGAAIEAYASSQKCSVVNQFVGHGVGLEFHEAPQVPHYRNTMHIPLVPGMIFTIEPMINIGVREAVIDPRNHWTARTLDNKPSAQWEHQLLITDTGHEVLTPWTR